jgi:hypothetical protein
MAVFLWNAFGRVKPDESRFPTNAAGFQVVIVRYYKYYNKKLSDKQLPYNTDIFAKRFSINDLAVLDRVYDFLVQHTNRFFQPILPIYVDF